MQKAIPMEFLKFEIFYFQITVNNFHHDSDI